MKHPSKMRIAFMGEIRWKHKNEMRIREKTYEITSTLFKRLWLQRVLIGAETLILTLLFGFSTEKYRSIPLKGNEHLLGEGIGIALAFVFGLAGVILITSYLILPRKIKEHAVEIHDDVEWME